MSFKPRFKITSRIASALMRIEAAKQAVDDLPITPSVLATLRQTARLYSTHYSTMIEGNRLTQEEVARVVEGNAHIAGRERDEKEVLGYYAALDEVERLHAQRAPITEQVIQQLHALVMAGGKRRTKPTPYRDGQNVIRDAITRGIVYLPPQAPDVMPLMQALVAWLTARGTGELPGPIRAAISHYQFATIHPYYDGNGRTARLITTLVLHLGGYGLKGLYSLEEYYARDLAAYYAALTVGPSHNYYEGRAKADITAWVDYFCIGMADSFEAVKKRAAEAQTAGNTDASSSLRQLDTRQRRALELFQGSETITSHDVAKLLGLSPRTARQLCAEWALADYLIVVNPARKNRKYGLAVRFRSLIS